MFLFLIGRHCACNKERPLPLTAASPSTLVVQRLLICPFASHADKPIRGVHLNFFSFSIEHVAPLSPHSPVPFCPLLYLHFRPQAIFSTIKATFISPDETVSQTHSPRISIGLWNWLTFRGELETMGEGNVALLCIGSFDPQKRETEVQNCDWRGRDRGRGGLRRIQG